MPVKIVNCKEISREEWLEYRRAGIGGSDAAVIVGLNPWRSLSELYADKLGLLPDKEDNEQMRIGRDLEEYVARRFCEATGKKVRRNNWMFHKSGNTNLTANVDREIVGENAGLECKTTSAFAKSDFENGQIPLYYYCQCVHYMNVMGYDRMYLAVLVLGKAFYWFTIDRNDDEIKALEDAENEFWNHHVITGIPPAGDGSESAERATAAIFRAKETLEPVSLFPADDRVAEYLRLQAESKALEKQANAVKESIQAFLGGAQIGKSDRYFVSWKETESTRVDTKALKEKYPQVYAAVAKTSTARRFTAKEIVNE